MKLRLLKILSFTMMLAMLISTMQVTLAVMAADLNADDTAFDSALNDSDFVSNDKFETADTADTTQYESVAYVIGEDESLRKENEKHFRMSDGSYIAAVYPEAVHYLEDDEWKDIDNTLTLTEDGYQNTAGTFDVVFGDGSDDGLYTITDGNYSMKFSLIRASTARSLGTASEAMKITLGTADAEPETFDVERLERRARIQDRKSRRKRSRN